MDLNHTAVTAVESQAVCVTRFDQLECLIVKVIMALGKTCLEQYMHVSTCSEILVKFQACGHTLETVPSRKVVGTIFVDAG